MYDPFAGSGTTIVEANVRGLNAVGCDVSAFNCLLVQVKTGAHRLAALELALRGALEAARRPVDTPAEAAGPWLGRWYAPQALAELLAYRRAIAALDEPAREVGSIVLSRAARSARLTTHSDLDFPKQPATGPYWCRKHRRECRPVEEAEKFLTRYTHDTFTRLRAFATVRTRARATVLHADARTADLPAVSGIVTSPPYPGLIDYHEQHRYAYELLGLDDRAVLEIGAAARGTSRRALAEYVDGMVAVFRHARERLPSGAPVVIVVNDRRGLYPTLLDGAGLVLADRLRRHVNRRTGLRRGEFYEDVLVCRT